MWIICSYDKIYGNQYRGLWALQTYLWYPWEENINVCLVSKKPWWCKDIDWRIEERTGQSLVLDWKEEKPKTFIWNQEFRKEDSKGWTQLTVQETKPGISNYEYQLNSCWTTDC